MARECHPCAAPNLRIAPTSLRSYWPKRKRFCADELFPSNCASERRWSVCFTATHKRPTRRRLPKRRCLSSQFGVGGAVRRWTTSRWRTNQDAGEGSLFPPLDRAMVQAIACELIYKTERPLRRQSVGDLSQRASAALRKPISPSTVWRILHDANLKPWRYEYWIFPRDPCFAEKAEIILDLYAGFWQGKPLGVHDYIISSDEKTSIQARLRCHPSLNAAPGRRRRIEFEYERGGALQYLAEWPVRRGYVTGR